jgi:hypothetical protein
MAGKFQMSLNSRREYFRVLKERYQKEASKKQRSLIVDEACLNTGLHRKSVLRALRRALCNSVQISRSGRPRKFSQDTIEILQRLYRESEYQCSGKLRIMIPTLVDQFKLELSKEVLKQLLQISPASIDRHLKKYKASQSLKGRSHTRPGSKIFKKMIPLKNLSNIAQGPGTLEADTVGHCGGNTSGEFAFSLTMTDEYSGWTRNRSVKNKCAVNIKPAIEYTMNTIPFEVFSVNFDNGSEFLNNLVYGYFTSFASARGIDFPMTRSRSYQKNDNARVEQKNWTHVRQIFGYERIEDQRLVDLMNEIYEVQNLLQNFFIPQYKLKSKVRVGSKIKKKYDAPKTPYQRLLESNIAEHYKQKLKDQYATLHYPTLKRQKDELIASFIKLQKQIESERRATNSNAQKDNNFGNTQL